MVMNRIGLLIMEVRILASLRINLFLFCLVTRGYLPRSILFPFSSAPPAPIRQDIPRPPQPLPRSTIRRNDEQSNDYLINSSHYVEEENERIYLNQLESDQYATVEPNHQEQVFTIKSFVSFICFSFI
jgi:hypothetical protein